jgi:beta-galactosidase beta subunit
LINYHGDCISVDKQKLDAYKTGKPSFECHDCYLEITSSAQNEINLEVSPNPQETIVIDEHCEMEYTCDLCGFYNNCKE